MENTRQLYTCIYIVQCHAESPRLREMFGYTAVIYTHLDVSCYRMILISDWDVTLCCY